MMTQSLLLEAYKSLNKQNSLVGKQLVLNSIELNDLCIDIYMDKTICVVVNINSTDRFGLEISITFIRNKGNIRIDFHKKRRMHTTVMFHDKKSFVYNLLYLDTHSSMFINSLLSELPQQISDYIYKINSKKWIKIKTFCLELIKLESKKLSFDIHIETTYSKKQFIYKSYENEL
tara:strand:- start:431 stop:955 length:525 start_codon:yes stop_codon:yes gene_type:complete